jgi:hypothetical protein
MEVDDIIQNAADVTKAVEIFNAITGGFSGIDGSITEKEGWLFMIALSLAKLDTSTDFDHYTNLASQITAYREYLIGERKQKIRWLNSLLQEDENEEDKGTAVTLPDGWKVWDGRNVSGPPELDPCQKTLVKTRGFKYPPSTNPGQEKFKWRWDHIGSNSDIVAYRPVGDKPSENEDKDEGGDQVGGMN